MVGPYGSEFSEDDHLCSDAGFRHRSSVDCAVEKTATQRQITMTQKFWELLPDAVIDRSSLLCEVQGRAGSSGNDSTRMRTVAARLHYARRGSQQGGLVDSES